VVCGHTIGRYAFIGAGAVVAKDVPDYALVVGVPGRIVGWMCQCGIRLAFTLGDEPAVQRTQCQSCGACYLKRGATVAEELAMTVPTS
jgi:UDP-2-acetamido-3-amino-2,3-dideoxy-glucuronate N-acetyltransferase